MASPAVMIKLTHALYCLFPGLGQIPARKASSNGEVPIHVPSCGANILCGPGLSGSGLPGHQDGGCGHCGGRGTGENELGVLICIPIMYHCGIIKISVRSPLSKNLHIQTTWNTVLIYQSCRVYPQNQKYLKLCLHELVKN